MVSKNHKAVIDMLATRNASMIPQFQELQITTKMPVETEEEIDLLEDELNSHMKKGSFG